VAKYGIDPAGVQRVLIHTSTAAGKFETILEPMSGYAESAAAGCGGSGAIVPALSEFFEAQATNPTSMNNRINACLTGAAAATKAYLHGDEEMVATYQQNASELKISHYPPK
jgi:hypothetical protein